MDQNSSSLWAPSLNSILKTTRQNLGKTYESSSSSYARRTSPVRQNWMSQTTRSGRQFLSNPDLSTSPRHQTSDPSPGLAHLQSSTEIKALRAQIAGLQKSMDTFKSEMGFEFETRANFMAESAKQIKKEAQLEIQHIKTRTDLGFQDMKRDFDSKSRLLNEEMDAQFDKFQRSLQEAKAGERVNFEQFSKAHHEYQLKLQEFEKRQAEANLERRNAEQLVTQRMDNHQASSRAELASMKQFMNTLHKELSEKITQQEINSNDYIKRKWTQVNDNVQGLIKESVEQMQNKNKMAHEAIVDQCQAMTQKEMAQYNVKLNQIVEDQCKNLIQTLTSQLATRLSGLENAFAKEKFATQHDIDMMKDHLMNRIQKIQSEMKYGQEMTQKEFTNSDQMVKSRLDDYETRMTKMIQDKITTTRKASETLGQDIHEALNDMQKTLKTRAGQKELQMTENSILQNVKDQMEALKAEIESKTENSTRVDEKEELKVEQKEDEPPALPQLPQEMIDKVANETPVVPSVDKKEFELIKKQLHKTESTLDTVRADLVELQSQVTEQSINLANLQSQKEEGEKEGVEAKPSTDPEEMKTQVKKIVDRELNRRERKTQNEFRKLHSKTNQIAEDLKAFKSNIGAGPIRTGIDQPFLQAQPAVQSVPQPQQSIPVSQAPQRVLVSQTPQTILVSQEPQNVPQEILPQKKPVSKSPSKEPHDDLDSIDNFLDATPKKDLQVDDSTLPEKSPMQSPIEKPTSFITELAPENPNDLNSIEAFLDGKPKEEDQQKDGSMQHMEDKEQKEETATESKPSLPSWLSKKFVNETKEEIKKERTEQEFTEEPGLIEEPTEEFVEEPVLDDITDDLSLQTSLEVTETDQTDSKPVVKQEVVQATKEEDSILDSLDIMEGIDDISLSPRKSEEIQTVEKPVKDVGAGKEEKDDFDSIEQFLGEEKEPEKVEILEEKEPEKLPTPNKDPLDNFDAIEDFLGDNEPKDDLLKESSPNQVKTIEAESDSISKIDSIMEENKSEDPHTELTELDDLKTDESFDPEKPEKDEESAQFDPEWDDPEDVAEETKSLDKSLDDLETNKTDFSVGEILKQATEDQETGETDEVNEPEDLATDATDFSVGKILREANVSGVSDIELDDEKQEESSPVNDSMVSEKTVDSVNVDELLNSVGYKESQTEESNEESLNVDEMLQSIENENQEKQEESSKKEESIIVDENKMEIREEEPTKDIMITETQDEKPAEDEMPEEPTLPIDDFGFEEPQEAEPFKFEDCPADPSLKLDKIISLQEDKDETDGFTETKEPTIPESVPDEPIPDSVVDDEEEDGFDLDKEMDNVTLIFEEPSTKEVANDSNQKLSDQRAQNESENEVNQDDFDGFEEYPEEPVEDEPIDEKDFVEYPDEDFQEYGDGTEVDEVDEVEDGFQEYPEGMDTPTEAVAKEDMQDAVEDFDLSEEEEDLFNLSTEGFNLQDALDHDDVYSITEDNPEFDEVDNDLDLDDDEFDF